MSVMHFENELFHKTQLRNPWTNTICYFNFIYIYDDLRHFVPVTQRKKREKHPWRSATFSKVDASPWVFFTFLDLHKSYKITKAIIYSPIFMLPNLYLIIK